MDAQAQPAREGLHQPLGHVAALCEPLVRLADPRLFQGVDANGDPNDGGGGGAHETKEEVGRPSQKKGHRIGGYRFWARFVSLPLRLPLDFNCQVGASKAKKAHSKDNDISTTWEKVTQHRGLHRKFHTESKRPPNGRFFTRPTRDV